VGHLYCNGFSFHPIITTPPVAVSPDVEPALWVKGYGIMARVIRNRLCIIVVKGLLPFPDNAGNLLTLGHAAGTGSPGHQEEKHQRWYHHPKTNMHIVGGHSACSFFLNYSKSAVSILCT